MTSLLKDQSQCLGSNLKTFWKTQTDLCSLENKKFQLAKIALHCITLNKNQRHKNFTTTGLRGKRTIFTLLAPQVSNRWCVPELDSFATDKSTGGLQGYK